MSENRTAIYLKFCTFPSFMPIISCTKFGINLTNCSFWDAVQPPPPPPPPHNWEKLKNAVENRVNPIQARLVLPFKGPRGVFRDPLMISGTIKASPMKLCTVIGLLKAYQNTKRNFQKYDLWRYNDVINKNNGIIRTSAKPGKLYIIRKEMMRAFRKCIFLIKIESLNQKLCQFK